MVKQSSAVSGGVIKRSQSSPHPWAQQSLVRNAINSGSGMGSLNRTPVSPSKLSYVASAGMTRCRTGRPPSEPLSLLLSGACRLRRHCRRCAAQASGPATQGRTGARVGHTAGGGCAVRHLQTEANAPVAGPLAGLLGPAIELPLAAGGTRGAAPASAAARAAPVDRSVAGAWYPVPPAAPRSAIAPPGCANSVGLVPLRAATGPRCSWMDGEK